MACRVAFPRAVQSRTPMRIEHVKKNASVPKGVTNVVTWE